MFAADHHTHSHASFDGEATVNELCLAALSAGLTELAITDHYDMDGIAEGYYPSFDAEKIRCEIDHAQEQFAGKLTVLHGLELGQSYYDPTLVPSIRQETAAQVIVGSVHNLIGVPDFAFLRYEEMPDALIAQLFDRYITGLEQTVQIKQIDILAHLTYPVRYLLRSGRTFSTAPWENRFRRLFHTMIETGICLEVNTSGLRQGLGCTFPDESLLRLYRDCGGRAITLGSDAHRAADVGADILRCYPWLQHLGFTEITAFGGGRHTISLAQCIKN